MKSLISRVVRPTLVMVLLMGVASALLRYTAPWWAILPGALVVLVAVGTISLIVSYLQYRDLPARCARVHVFIEQLNLSTDEGRQSIVEAQRQCLIQLLKAIEAMIVKTRDKPLAFFQENGLVAMVGSIERYGRNLTEQRRMTQFGKDVDEMARATVKGMKIAPDHEVSESNRLQMQITFDVGAVAAGTSSQPPYDSFVHHVTTCLSALTAEGQLITAIYGDFIKAQDERTMEQKTIRIATWTLAGELHVRTRKHEDLAALTRGALQFLHIPTITAHPEFGRMYDEAARRETQTSS